MSKVLDAQSFYFRHYQVEHGLSNNSVICSLQDKKGFMWFGTKDGLNRFDGYSFKIFRNIPRDSLSIGSNFIHSLYEDKNENLWVGTDRGLFRYNPSSEDFNRIAHVPEMEVRDIVMDDNQHLWFIAGLVLYEYNILTKSLTAFDKPGIDAGSLCIAPDGRLWIANVTGSIMAYNATHRSFDSYDVFSHSKIPKAKWIEKIRPFGKNMILIGTSTQGVKMFNTKTLIYEDVFTYNDDNTEIFARDFIQSNDDEFWTATESGLYVYNVKTKKCRHLIKEYNNPSSLSDNATYTLLKDKEGGTWCGTYFGGINYLPKQYTFFQKYFPQFGTSSISGTSVREICADNYGHLWIGTEDAGLNRLDIKTGIFQTYKPSGSGSISHSNIHGLLALGDTLFIGTFEHGLDIMRIKSRQVIKHYNADTQHNTFKSNFIECFYKKNNGEILVGTARGLFTYNMTDSGFMPVPQVPDISLVQTILEDKNGTIWAGTYREGLYYYNTATKKNGMFRYNLNDDASLSNNTINNIFEDSRHIIWITTENGFCRYNMDKNNFKRYSTANGLPSNVTYSILEDNKGDLWITTSKGLVCFDPITEAVKIYTKANGLLTDQFNYNSAYKDKSGKLYFGSLKGLICFNPADFTRNTYVPTVYLTGIQVFNKELPVNKNNSPLKKSVSYTNKIILQHDQSSFSFDFAALSYTAPEMAEYAYKMEGLDKDWVYLKTNRKVYFTKLSPGKYTFKVKASNSSGIWNDVPTILQIEILPPWWASDWAYLIYFLSGTLLAFVLLRNYHKKVEEKNRRKIELLENEKEKEIYHAKIEFFTNVAHEIRTPLTLIKLPLEKTIEKATHLPEIKENLKIMEKNTNRLVDLTNQLLDFRKTETNGFSLSFVKADISEMLEEIFSRFRPAAEQKELSFKLQLPGIHLHAYIDKEAFTKIISNLLNNAIKYADTTVHLRLMPFNSEDTHFSIEVKNDGFIIPAEMKEKIFEPFYRMKETEKQPGTGIGLPLSRSLAELHNGTLSLNITDALQNLFVLVLPIHQEKEFQLYEEVNEDKEEAVAEQYKEAHTTSTKPTILLVEDHKEILDFIAKELNDQYTVTKAHNGKEALRILEAENIQLVISDVMMPVMDGFDLCKKIKTSFEFSHTPVILLTARNTLQSKIEGLELGADAYIEKPFSQHHLQAQIQSLLNNRNKIREYFAKSPLAHIKSIAYSKADEHFLDHLNDIILQNIENTSLDVEQLAKLMHMSKATLYRKIKGLSNMSPNELINLARLKKAAALLAEKDYKIYEVADLVGYAHQSNFGRDFHRQFSMTPSEYVAMKHMQRSEL
ncbi:two-component regulator propeller domain-containing protein [Danxiaibacter flavus]|uniref:histidine kinase n=1 Tax=Danxiaibacter flavus TaxID=3049108 RepID=A0ABV3ZAV3_9BACT|nr:two-component regulator propeller domain-containing protein [Chitinophagaceae bacterium DXS]